MVAQLAQSFQVCQGKKFTDQHFSAIHSHPDLIDYNNFQDLDYSKFNSLLLFPDFLPKFKQYTLELIKEKQTALNIKLRVVGYLTCASVFMAQDQNEFIKTLKNCFDLALYVRASNNSSVNEIESDIFDPREIPFFQKYDVNTLKKALLLLIEM